MHNRILIDSSVIAAVAYSDEAALDIEFTSGATYRYFAVPEQLFTTSSPPTPRGPSSTAASGLPIRARSSTRDRR
jgi:hypothetical protein